MARYQRTSKTSKSVVVLTVLCVLFVAGAFGLVWHWWHKPVEITPTLVHTDGMRREYRVEIPRTGWYDTGIWAGAYYYVSVEGGSQPYKINIEWATVAATLNVFNRFNARLETSSRPTRFNNVAWVDNQGKLLLYSEKPQTLTVIVSPLSSAARAEVTQAEEEWHQEHNKPIPPMKTWEKVMVGGLFLVVILVAISSVVVTKRLRQDKW